MVLLRDSWILYWERSHRAYNSKTPMKRYFELVKTLMPFMLTIKQMSSIYNNAFTIIEI